MSLSDRQRFLHHLAQTSDFPLMLEIIRAEGIFMYGADGKEYMDLISGIGVSNVGHRHPKVIQAIKEQLDQYLHLMVYGEYIQSPQVRLAEALTRTLPEPLTQVYLVNSGSEAIEGALKLAKRFTGRPKIISCINSYHGSSAGALSAGGNELLKQNFRPLIPGHFHLHFNEPGELDLIDEDTAAVLIEVVQGEAGIRLASREYLQALQARCNEMGAILILDEIQSGFGRTGKFWAFEHYDLTPDILVSAKGMGGGMPIGCFISSEKVMSCLKDHPALGHITTFGGHPVSAAASLATLTVIQEEQLMVSIPQKEQLFRNLLVHPKIKEVRSLGLMMAVALDSFDLLKSAIDRAINLGVITDWFLFSNSSMRIAPPLIITEEEIKKACKLILQALD